MAKQPKWSEDELKKLNNLLDQRKTYQEISKIIHRSVNGIKISLNRKLFYRPICLDCGKRINNRKGNRLRCIECSQKRVAKQNKDWWTTERGLQWIKTRNDIKRFGRKRETVIKRDKEKCVKCGMTRHEHLLKFGCDITIDHINGKGRNSKKQDNSIKNLQTLCLVCHGKKDIVRRRKDWSMCAKHLSEFNKNRPRSLKSCQKKLELLDNDKWHIIEVKKDKFILDSR